MIQINVCEAFVRRAWHIVSALYVPDVLDSVAIINRKQDLSLWGQSLVNGLSLGIWRPGF